MHVSMHRHIHYTPKKLLTCTSYWHCTVLEYFCVVYVGVDLNVHLGIANYKRPPVAKVFSEIAQVVCDLAKEMAKVILMRWFKRFNLLLSLVKWEPNLLNCYWQAENRPRHFSVIKWKQAPNHDSGCVLFGWFAKDLRLSLATVPQKQWREGVHGNQ